MKKVRLREEEIHLLGEYIRAFKTNYPVGNTKYLAQELQLIIDAWEIANAEMAST
jgi:hypothetical protein